MDDFDMDDFVEISGEEGATADAGGLNQGLHAEHKGEREMRDHKERREAAVVIDIASDALQIEHTSHSKIAISAAMDAPTAGTPRAAKEEEEEQHQEEERDAINIEKEDKEEEQEEDKEEEQEEDKEEEQEEDKEEEHEEEEKGREERADENRMDSADRDDSKATEAATGGDGSEKMQGDVFVEEEPRSEGHDEEPGGFAAVNAEGADWFLLEDDGEKGLEQTSSTLLKQEMVARVFRFKSLLQSKLLPQAESVRDRQVTSAKGGERKRKSGEEPLETAREGKEEGMCRGGLTSPRGAEKARPAPVLCGMSQCVERAEKHGGCSKCSLQLCKEHSLEVDASEVNSASSSRWRKSRMAEMGGAAFVHCDEEVFSVLSDTVMLCLDCKNRFIQTIGVLIDRSERFQILRSREKARASSSLTKSILLLVPQAERFIREPMASVSSSMAIKNPFKTLTLTVTETWSTCAGCSEFFERMKKRLVCELCTRSFCTDCGTNLVQFSGRQLLADYSQVIDQIGRNASPIRAQSCNQCRDALLMLARRKRFGKVELNERGTRIQAHYAEFKAAEHDLRSSFSDLLAQTTKADASEQRDRVNRLINTYKRVGNLLVALVTRPYGKHLEPTAQDVRLAQQLARMQKNVLTMHVSMLHSHDELLRQS